MIDRNQTQQHRGKEFERWVKLPDLAENAPVFEGTDVPVQYLFAYVDDRYSVYAFLGTSLR